MPIRDSKIKNTVIGGCFVVLGAFVTGLFAYLGSHETPVTVGDNASGTTVIPGDSNQTTINNIVNNYNEVYPNGLEGLSDRKDLTVAALDTCVLALAAQDTPPPLSIDQLLQPLADFAKKLREQEAGPYNGSDVARVLAQRALEKLNEGQLADFEHLLDEAATEEGRVGQTGQPKTDEAQIRAANFRATIAASKYAQGGFTEAGREWENAARLLPAKQPRRMVPYLLYAGHSYFINKQYKDAESSYRKLLEIYNDGIQTDTEFTDARVKLANVYIEQGRYSEAGALLDECLKFLENLHSHNNILLGPVYISQGILESRLDRCEDAVPLLQRGVGFLTLYEGSEVSPLFKATGLYELARCQHSLGHLRNSEVEFNSSLSIRKDELGPNHWLVAITLASLATVYSDENQAQDALSRCDRAEDIVDLTLNKDHPMTQQVKERCERVRHSAI